VSDDPTSAPTGAEALETAMPDAMAHLIDGTTLEPLAGAETPDGERWP
jgi:hypothetical protein